MVRGNGGLIQEELPDPGRGEHFYLGTVEFLLFLNVPCPPPCLRVFAHEASSPREWICLLS